MDLDNIKLRKNMNLNQEDFNKQSFEKQVKQKLGNVNINPVDMQMNFNNNTLSNVKVVVKNQETNNLTELNYNVNNKNKTLELNKQIIKEVKTEKSTEESKDFEKLGNFVSKMQYNQFKKYAKKKDDYLGFISNSDLLGSNTTVSVTSLMTWLNNPETNWKNLVKLDLQLTNKNGIYASLKEYMCKQASFFGTLTPHCRVYNIDLNPEDAFARYIETQDVIDNIKPRSEFAKMMNHLFTFGFYCGYLEETATGSTFIDLSFDNIKVYSIQDGMYNVAMDFSTLERATETQLLAYPVEIVKPLEKYKNASGTAKEEQRYYSLPPEKTIVLTFGNRPYPCPYFIHLITDIYNLEDLKALDKTRIATDSLRILGTGIPLNEKDGRANDLLIDPEIMEGFIDRMNEILQERYGTNILILPYLNELQKFEFTPKNTDNADVANATQQIFNDAGINSQLFNSDSITALKSSIAKDENIIYDIYRQMEVWINRKLEIENFNDETFKFTYRLLDCTYFSQDTFIDRKLKLAAINDPTAIVDLVSMQGGNLSTEIGMSYFVKDVFNVLGRRPTIESIHTASGSSSTDTTSTTSTGGRPEAPIENLTDSGVKTRESDGNSNVRN